MEMVKIKMKIQDHEEMFELAVTDIGRRDMYFHWTQLVDISQPQNGMAGKYHKVLPLSQRMLQTIKCKQTRR